MLRLSNDFASKVNLNFPSLFQGNLESLVLSVPLIGSIPPLLLSSAPFNFSSSKQLINLALSHSTSRSPLGSQLKYKEQ